MIAKVKKSTAKGAKKDAKAVKKVPKKSSKVVVVPEIKEEPTEAPKKLKGISKRFNVDKPSKKPKVKKEIKAEETPGNAAEAPADVKPLRKQKQYTFGVVQIKCLPHGFFEEQLREFFTQFGDVHRVRVKRSLKTGKSTGVGFVEFRVPEVAEIAAQTMNNYLLMKNILKTRYIPPDKVTPNIMKSRVKVKVVDGQQIVLSSTMARQRKAIEVYNASPSEKSLKNRQSRFQKKLQAKKRQLAEAGIDFDEEKVVKRPKKSTKSTEEPQEEKSVAAEEQVEDSPEETEPPKKALVSKKIKNVKKIKEKSEKVEKPQKSAAKTKKTVKVSPKVAPVAPKIPKKKELAKKEGKKVLKVGQKKSKKLVKK